jgi:hypothetical protein
MNGIFVQLKIGLSCRAEFIVSGYCTVSTEICFCSEELEGLVVLEPARDSIVLRESCLRHSLIYVIVTERLAVLHGKSERLAVLHGKS